MTSFVTFYDIISHFLVSIVSLYHQCISQTQLEYRYRKFILGKERQHLMLVAKMKGEAIGMLTYLFYPSNWNKKKILVTLLLILMSDYYHLLIMNRLH
jgi:hypothetical protein